ncbi:MAG: PEGA domain-containing protein [Ignavibacteria bacterium]|nr:PEGA domain-containing protein [Ignavibacteria bacterium]
MKKYLTPLLLFSMMILFFGCSTMINTTTQVVEVKTTPTNAKITINGKRFGNSPQYVNIERGINHVIKFELDGYELYETQITQQMSYWYWGNALNGFLPGMLIDWYNGSMYNLIPSNIDVELSQVKVVEPIKKK